VGQQRPGGDPDRHPRFRASCPSIVCGITAYLSVRFLVRWFQTRTLTLFAIYCLAFGALSIIRFL
jgi:undecaprenyl pyrophosphate phosphatase UppP